MDDLANSKRNYAFLRICAQRALPFRYFWGNRSLGAKGRFPQAPSEKGNKNRRFTEKSIVYSCLVSPIYVNSNQRAFRFFFFLFIPPAL